MSESIKKTESQDSVQDFLLMHASVQHRIYGFIMSFVGNWADTDDIYQETTSVMWKKFEEFTPGTDFLSWSLKIAHFQILSHKKKAIVSKKHFSQTTLENLYEVAISSVNDSGQTIDALRNCMMKLSEQSRNLLSLRYEDGITIPKVAQRIQRSVHTLYKEYRKIHTLLFRCVRKEMGWS
jgi:RNA polymerase sigma-70 factor (ECF subfamily)